MPTELNGRDNHLRKGIVSLHLLLMKGLLLWSEYWKKYTKKFHRRHPAFIKGVLKRTLVTYELKSKEQESWTANNGVALRAKLRHTKQPPCRPAS